jgi:hypothetical protein
MTDFKEEMPGEIRYASFVRRLTANLIDGILMTAWMLPALYYFFGIRACHAALGFRALVGTTLSDMGLSVRVSSGP